MPAANVEDKGAKQEPRAYSWWSWRRGRQSREVTPASDIPIAENITKENITVTEVKEAIEPELTKVEMKKVESEYVVSQDFLMLLLSSSQQEVY